MKKYEHLLYSAIGLVALALILVAFNYLISRVPGRVDLTDGKLYTLSEGTKKILRNLQAPVKVKLYISQGESVPVPLRSFAQRVEDLVRELKREFEVKEVPLSAKEVDKDITVLLLIHPRDMQPEQEYALDQFVLRGGKLIAFVDPYAYFDQQPTMPGVPPMPSSSSLPLLFKAWGVNMDPGKVVSDVVFGSGGGQRYTPTVLSLNRTAFSRDDIVTGQIETLLYAFGGAFEVNTKDLKVTELVKSSPNSMLVDNANATKSGDEATKSFQPSGKAMPLAVRLTGKFKTAFPDGVTEGEKPVP